MSLKIKIEFNAEAPVILIVKASGVEKLEDLSVYGSWK